MITRTFVYIICMYKLHIDRFRAKPKCQLDIFREMTHFHFPC